MALKGAATKEKILFKLKKLFPDMFCSADGKEWRIPAEEDGVAVEIKIALTCAKECVQNKDTAPAPSMVVQSGKPIVLTEAEKDEIERIIAEFGLGV